MKIIKISILLLLIGAIVLAGDKPGSVRPTPSFDKIKSLAGSWKGKDAQGKSILVSYKVVSAGNSVMEEMIMGDISDAMITMYHLDGDATMLTHYCSMGNQPRMRAAALAKDGKSLSFSFVDATNLASPQADCMTDLVVRFKDADHFSQQWTMRVGGKSQPHETFEYERVK